MSPTYFIRCLALLALLHQQGACACGCPEHNGWVISARSLLTETALTGHEHCDHGDDALQANAAHCDGSADTVYLVPTTPRVVDLPTMLDGTLSASAVNNSVATQLTTTFSSIDLPCLPGSAPLVRAGLGVFLL